MSLPPRDIAYMKYHFAEGELAANVLEFGFFVFLRDIFRRRLL
jgi:hypothetical protein